MSIKRSREPARRRAPGGEDVPRAKKEPERVYRWEEDVAKRSAERFLSYAPAHRYAKDTLLTHKTFGPGIVTRVDGPRVEVLFRDGPKKLAHSPTGDEAPVAGPAHGEAAAAQEQASAAPAAPDSPAGPDSPPGQPPPATPNG